MKVSEPRGMVFVKLDGHDTIVYKVIEGVTDDCIITDLRKQSCPYSAVLGGDVDPKCSVCK